MLTKIFKGAALCLVFLGLVLPLAGCSDRVETVSYTDSAGGYGFSYPETWELYSIGGSTCISIADVGGVLPYAMVRFSAFDNTDGITAADYWNGGIDGFSAVYDSYRIQQNKRGVFDKEGVNSAYAAVVEVSLKGETKLDGQPTAAGEAASYILHQLVFEGDGRICVVSYLSSKTNYEIYGDVMDTIKSSFAFTAAEALPPVDDKGYADFSIPVPAGWTLDTAEAYYKLSLGRATVVACAFSLDRSATAKQYWEDTYRESVKIGLVDFKEISVEELRLGGVSAVDVYYTAKSVSGAAYNFRQCIAVKGAEVYIITLTADDADYDTASEGYEEIIKGFSFK